MSAIIPIINVLLAAGIITLAYLCYAMPQG
jgi:hypothetical protein